MQGKSTVNTFNEGMVHDVDVLNTKATSYRDAMNGRLMFNKDGTYSWQPENGSKISVVITPRGGLDGRKYKLIGNTGNDNIVVLFSVHEESNPLNNNSEIGLFSIDETGQGSYKTLFNDADDVNGDKLNFLSKNQIEARFVFENPGIIRAYWVDGVASDSNQPRTITFKYDEALGNPSDVNAYSGEDLSVHSMNTQAEFSMGLIKYVKNVGGDLKTGVYQYTYSLGTESGYNTPWYPLTRRIFVNSDDVVSDNWHDYEMGGSGITSSKGNRIEIKGIDQRYSRIRVGYSLTLNGSTVNEQYIFEQTNIDSDVMTFDHATNGGEPILEGEFTESFSGIVAAKTLNIKDATLYYGNIRENFLSVPDMEPILENLVVTPRFKDMRSDEKPYSSPDKDPLPITNQTPKTGITQLRQHSAAGGVEDYQIVNDYVNYKGTQIDHLYPAHFRAEKYRYAIVFYDKLGFESFAFHLCDFQFPEQSDDRYSWFRIKENGDLTSTFNGTLSEKAWPTNNYNYSSLRSDKVWTNDNGNTSGSDADNGRQVSHLRIMGLSFSGIDISSVKEVISGFKIVRVERDKTILMQGLIYPTVKVTDDSDGSIIEPFPNVGQRWDNGAGSPLSPSTPKGNATMYGAFSVHSNPEVNYTVKANVSVFYPAALDFGSANFPSTHTQDRIKLSGGCWHERGYITDTDRHYGKYYYSMNDFHEGPLTNESSNSDDPYPEYLAQMQLTKWEILGLGATIDGQENHLPNFDGSLRLNNNCQIYASWDGEDKDAHGKTNSVFIKHHDFNSRSSGAGVYSPFYHARANNPTMRSKSDSGATLNPSYVPGVFIGNYVRPNLTPYGGTTLSALENNIFIGTGHFQPINNQTFDTQGMPADDIFNDIDVFGGDCFLDYHGFMRLYPFYEELIEEDEINEFSVGTIHPLEYDYNFTLREGPSDPGRIYPSVGSKTFVHPDAGRDGLYVSNDTTSVEEFNLNATLDFEEIQQFYSPKPINFKDNTHYPVRWRHTRLKFYGDPVDNWRLFDVNAFKDLNGEHGEVTSSIYLMNQIYSWQIGAFGRLRASDRALVNSDLGDLSTSIGPKLDGVDYISTEHGNQHQWGLFKSDSAAYWVDVNKRKLMRFAQDGKVPFSDLKGVHQFLEEELPLFEDYDRPAHDKGVHGVFDFGNNTAMFTFSRDRRIHFEDNFYLISRSRLGKSYNPHVVHENQTAILKPAVPNRGVYIPVGNELSGVNENTIFYISAEDYPVNIYNYKSGNSTLLFTTVVGQFYRLFRNSLNSDWQYEEVTANDATPQKASLSYVEGLNVFDNYHSHAPTHYFGTKYLVLSNYADNEFAEDNALYVHDMGLTCDFPSYSKKAYLSVSVNEAPMMAKTFDSLRVNCNKDFNDHLDTFLMKTESQFQLIDMENDSRRKYLEEILRFPLRNHTQKDRMRGKHLLMTLELKNNQNHNDRITNLVTYYRPSNRM